MATSPVQQTQSSSASFCSTFQTKYNGYVEWTTKYTSKCVGSTFSLKLTGTEAAPADGTLKKVAKVFFMLLSSIALFPLALAICAISWVKDCLWGSKTDEKANTQTAPPATTAATQQATQEATVPTQKQQTETVQETAATTAAIKV